MSINFMGRKARAEQGDEQYDVYEADAERLYDSFSDLYEDFDEGRSKAPFVIIGALLAVAIVGGGLAFAYKRGSSDGADGPTVILAERTPTKVELQDPGGIDIPHQDRQVFNEVAGTSEAEGESAANQGASSVAESVETPANELGRAGFTPTGGSGAALVPAGNDQAAASGTSAGASGAGSDEFTIGALASRVTRTAPVPVAPSGGWSGQGVAEQPTPAAARPAPLPSPVAVEPTVPAASESLSPEITPSPGTGVFEPRRVQTVAIGPDGSVIANATPAATPEVAAAQAGTGSTGTATRALSPAVTPVPARPGTTLPQQEPQRVAPSASDSGASGGGSNAIEAALRAGAERLQPQAEAQTSLFAPSPRPKPRPTTRVAAADPAAAARPQIPASATNAAAARAIEGFAVQVASHRRQAEAVAAFADLQQRFPNLISGYQPLIQRADLGERGIFYRLRIGPVATKSDADRLCASLTSAGLPGCLVRSL